MLEPGEPMYIFGYGSIIWKWGVPDVTPLEVIRGKIYGWNRTFNMKSMQHRGNLEFPGRAVTIEEAEPANEVHGIAYKVAYEDVEKTIENMNIREKRYDKRL